MRPVHTERCCLDYGNHKGEGADLLALCEVTPCIAETIASARAPAATLAARARPVALQAPLLLPLPLHPHNYSQNA